MTELIVKYGHTDNILSKAENAIHGIFKNSFGIPDIEMDFNVYVDPKEYENVIESIRIKNAGIPAYDDKKQIIDFTGETTSYLVPFLGTLYVHSEEGLGNTIKIKKADGSSI